MGIKDQVVEGRLLCVRPHDVSVRLGKGVHVKRVFLLQLIPPCQKTDRKADVQGGQGVLAW